MPSPKRKRRKELARKAKLRRARGPRYPIGTLALYGPNGKDTTKLVAAVFTSENAEPVIEKWVSTRVLHDERIMAQVKAFFDKHKVKHVTATNGNMGCPHEEGIDFPVGEDCPFCPFWAGKQGSKAWRDAADDMD